MGFFAKRLSLNKKLHVEETQSTDVARVSGALELTEQQWKSFEESASKPLAPSEKYQAEVRLFRQLQAKRKA